jgi:hypothetical protein
VKKFEKGDGGANESRTRDLLHAMQARYQLRYSPKTKNASLLFSLRSKTTRDWAFSLSLSSPFSLKTTVEVVFLTFEPAL